jgi:tRNA pseudouridine38-40 synthase
MGTYNPLYRNFVYQYGKKLNISKIKEGLSYFKGTHDFTTFVCKEDKRTDKVRTIFDAYLKEDGILIITFI